VTLTYALSRPRGGGGPGGIYLAGPKLNVPLQNIEWSVVLPDGFELERYRGDLELLRDRGYSGFGLKDYIAVTRLRREEQAEGAVALLEKANSYMMIGEAEKARRAFNRVAKSQLLDAAGNEDARVQLTELQTRQAIAGLNTRQQRVYLNNAAELNDLDESKKLKQAAGKNPILNGADNWRPQELDEMLQENSADQNTAFRRIAERLVEQQLAAEPAPRAIQVTIPKRGKILKFTRSVQVDGQTPLGLELEFRSRRGGGDTVAVLVVVVACLGCVFLIPDRGTRSETV